MLRSLFDLAHQRRTRFEGGLIEGNARAFCFQLEYTSRQVGWETRGSRSNLSSISLTVVCSTFEEWLMDFHMIQQKLSTAEEKSLGYSCEFPRQAHTRCLIYYLTRQSITEGRNKISLNLGEDFWKLFLQVAISAKWTTLKAIVLHFLRRNMFNTIVALPINHQKPKPVLYMYWRSK